MNNYAKQDYKLKLEPFMAAIWGTIRGGYGGVNALVLGTGGAFVKYTPQSGVSKTGNFLIFIRLLKIFSRKFSNFVHTIKKTIFNFTFFAL